MHKDLALLADDERLVREFRQDKANTSRLVFFFVFPDLNFCCCCFCTWEINCLCGTVATCICKSLWSVSTRRKRVGGGQKEGGMGKKSCKASRKTGSFLNLPPAAATALIIRHTHFFNRSSASTSSQQSTTLWSFCSAELADRVLSYRCSSRKERTTPQRNRLQEGSESRAACRETVLYKKKENKYFEKNGKKNFFL